MKAHFTKKEMGKSDRSVVAGQIVGWAVSLGYKLHNSSGGDNGQLATSYRSGMYEIRPPTTDRPWTTFYRRRGSGVEWFLDMPVSIGVELTKELITVAMTGG